MTLRNDVFLRACRCEPTPRTPVWVMRQAGRYLPEYRAIREKYDFLTMCRTPELATAVTIQPVEIIGVDAAILFSDIMVVPQAMGMELELVEARGPVLHNPIRDAQRASELHVPDPDDELGYVMDAIRMTRRELDGRVPLIGFSGSPWTLFAYMVEGSGSKAFRHPKEMVYANPELARHLLDRITEAVTGYLLAQVRTGVDTVQVFDTWGGILPPDEYREFSLSYMARVATRIRETGVPVILYSKDCAHSLEQIAGTGARVVGIDWRTDISDARSRIGMSTAIQGNLDPAVLFSTPGVIRAHVARVLRDVGPGGGHIFNLGHGVLPGTPVDNLKALVAAVAEESPRYHETVS